MDIKSARKILGETAEKMTDIDIQESIDSANLLSDISIDIFLKMTPKERNKYLTSKK